MYIMPEQRRPRTHFSAQERAWRSKLTQIVSGYPFLRGTLQERFRVCGKPNCRCTRGEKHRALYVVLSDGKRQRQLYVPEAWEARVREWVAHHRAVKELIREVSEMYWRKVEQREE
jgi:hypothetical protein